MYYRTDCTTSSGSTRTERYKGKLKSLDQIKRENLPGIRYSPGIADEMLHFFGSIHERFTKTIYGYYIIASWKFREEWFEWIEDDDGKMVYDGRSMNIYVDNMIEDIVEGL